MVLFHKETSVEVITLEHSEVFAYVGTRGLFAVV